MKNFNYSKWQLWSLVILRVAIGWHFLYEWIEAIREGKQPSCNIDQAFEEGITAAMATMAYKENRTVYWDRENEQVL